MKYKVLKPHGGKIDGRSGRRREGESYSIDDGEAAVPLRSGHIERVKQPVRKPQTKVSEHEQDGTE